MPNNNKDQSTLHPRSKHHGRYDLKALVIACPDLKEYVSLNKYGNESIDFFNAAAVKTLNKALLLFHYGIIYWDIPTGFLTPPIPGRADYIHHIADLLASCNQGIIPTDNKIKVLDIGMGANCIYPIIGHHEYGWSFIGSDIDEVAIKNVNTIIAANPHLEGKIDCRLQRNPQNIFNGILSEKERIDITICNPPFHASLKDAKAGTMRKLKNLKNEKAPKVELNFGGQGKELWTAGGEKQFIINMINESAEYAKSVCWFSSLVSKEDSLPAIFDALENANATAYETIGMGQGNKSSRLVAWTYLSKAEETEWVKERWA